MRKLTKILLLAAVALPLLVSCNKEDQPTKSALATILPYWNEAGFTIMLDNGETMYPSRVMVDYKVKEEAQRAFILFTENSETVAPYTYNVDIHGITEIETRNIDLVTSSNENMGTDGIKVLNAYIGGGYLNIEFAVNVDPYSQNQKHVVTLVDNQIGGAPEYTSHYPLELRFKRDHKLEEGRGMTISSIACFRIGEYELGNLGCNGYELKFIGLENETGKDPDWTNMESVKVNVAQLTR